MKSRGQVRVRFLLIWEVGFGFCIVGFRVFVGFIICAKVHRKPTNLVSMPSLIKRMLSDLISCISEKFYCSPILSNNIVLIFNCLVSSNSAEKGIKTSSEGLLVNKTTTGKQVGRHNALLTLKHYIIIYR